MLISGDVFGQLLSEKIFSVDNVSGIIDVPNTKSGGACHIETVSGYIKIFIN